MAPILGLRRRSLLGFVCAFLVVLALALGLGLGLSRRSAASQASTPNGSGGSCSGSGEGAIVVSQSPPPNASQPILPAFISYALEFDHLPYFAGNTSNPNVYSDNMLNNIGNLTGTKPYMRVGGNAQDQTLYSNSLVVAAQVNATASQSSSMPKIVNIGSSFFESYGTWPGTKFIHGFNMALVVGSNSDDAWATLLETVPLACNALSGGKLLYWEYGNEPDLYANAAKGFVRSKDTWSDQNYLDQWNNGTKQIQASLAQACPDMATGDAYGFLAPSMWNPNNKLLTLEGVWNGGLDNDADVKEISLHNYVASTNSTDISLQGTLMNHTRVTSSLSRVVNSYQSLGDTGRPLVLSETNSLSNIGEAGVTDTLGAALWAVDYCLWCATQNISRIHLQQGLNFLYNSWQPLQTKNVSIGTKAPYYGNIAVATMLGNSSASQVQIASLALPSSDTDAAYAAYSNGTLARLAVLNMRLYDSTTDGSAPGQQNYTFQVPSTFSNATVRRLSGPDGLSKDGISFDGYSYPYADQNAGMPVLNDNVTRGETLAICNGVFSVQLNDSSAAILDLS